MGILTPWLAADTPTSIEVQAHASSELAAATWPDNLPGMTSTVWVTRKQAMQVPTVARARNIICGTIAELPIAGWNTQGERIAWRPWLRQPERHVPRAHTIAWTVDDLLFSGVAYWRVAAVYAEDGRPLAFERIAPDRVSYDVGAGNRVARWRVDGQPAPPVGVGRLVVFHALEEGVLARAGRTITAAIALEKAAERYAAEPVPASILKNKGVDIPKTKVAELLASWRVARQTNATAYLSSDLDLQAVGFDPEALQLVEARAHLAAELARVMNVDAFWIGADTGGSLTYSNATQHRRALHELTLRHYLGVIEQRLSMDDVTAQDLTVRFSLDEFLRGDPKERAEVYGLLLTHGVIDVDEARAMEDLSPRGGTA